ncbi:FecR domain-containing protein [Deminuibacter soli]|uniref:DUF4974 domain-containing protein n=1 Tax=Deminuibacter soli TaxID=2291815 RepID=A0A3E1NHX7_9BACT|nr:FecR domain-containing protein [Deminuibacter soli]RFM27378.1 DUF4974 domain-containing protein [Deminuibacter soli]
MESSDIIDELLVKYLLGEASAAERQQVAQWLALSDNNQRYFQQFELIWQQSKQLAATSEVDEEAAWQRFKQRRSKPAQEQPAPVKNMRQWLRPLMAAAVLLLISTGVWLWHAYNSNRLLNLYAQDAVVTDTLPDGSIVTLNKQSSIHYMAHFTGGERAITLSGEAFFNVAPRADKPFIIYASDAVIKVLGTSFNVRTKARETEVIVETGSVQVSKHQYAVQLQPNEKALVSDEDVKPLKQVNSDELYNYYRTKTFVCNKTPLYKLVDKLNEAYNAHIEIAGSNLRNLQLTTTFHNQSLNEILEIIRQTFQPAASLSIVKEGDKIIIR